MLHIARSGITGRKESIEGYQKRLFFLPWRDKISIARVFNRWKRNRTKTVRENTFIKGYSLVFGRNGVNFKKVVT
jgi:hypothetical protein